MEQQELDREEAINLIRNLAKVLDLGLFLYSPALYSPSPMNAMSANVPG